MENYWEKLHKKHEELLSNIKVNLPELEIQLNELKDHWVEEDRIYRFWHQSFKIVYLQEFTDKIVLLLKKIKPKATDINVKFLEIIGNGTGKEFDLSWNLKWLEETLPITQAYFHAKYFLEMAIKYGNELDEAPTTLPSGWAALLHLYNIR